jgi:hypothetical protein
MNLKEFKIYHKKLKCFLDDNTKNKKVINYFSYNNQYEYICLTSNDINKLDKFLKKYSYVFNSVDLISDDSTISGYIIFNLSENDIKFICDSLKIFSFSRYKIGTEIKYYNYEPSEKIFFREIN